MSLMNALPLEVVMHIASFLNTPDLLTCNYVSGGLKSITRDYSLWKRFFVDIKVLQTNEPPVGRLCHTSIVHDDKMYVFGGHTTQPSSEYFHTVRQDMHSYDFARREWQAVCDEGSRRTEHTTVVDDKKMYVFGGYSGVGYEAAVLVFEFATNLWSTMEVKGDHPAARSAHTAVVYGRSMFVFGGWNGTQCMNDLFELNLDTFTWSRIHYTGEPPCTRCSHGAALVDDKMYIFGGYAIEKSGEPNKGYLNDLYEFDFATKSWKRSHVALNNSIPSPRSRFRIVSHKESLYLFAGWNSNTHFNNLFKYNTRIGQWEEIYTNFDEEGIGQFSLIVHGDMMYVFSGYSPKSGSRTNLFAYPLAPCYQQAS